MLQGSVKLLFKLSFSLAFWVYVLSLNWDNRSLFDRAHELLVENPLAELIDEEMRSLWDKVSLTALSTYAQLREAETPEEDLR